MLENSKKAYDLYTEIISEIETMTMIDYETKFSVADDLLELAQKMEMDMQNQTNVTVATISAISYIRKAEAARDYCLNIQEVYKFCVAIVQDSSGCGCGGNCGSHEDSSHE